MQAVNDYVIVDIVKEGPKKVGGLILTDETDETNRYKNLKLFLQVTMLLLLAKVILYIMMQ